MSGEIRCPERRICRDRRNLRIANSSSLGKSVLVGIVGIVAIIRTLARLDSERCADEERKEQGHKALSTKCHCCDSRAGLEKMNAVKTNAVKIEYP